MAKVAALPSGHDTNKGGLSQLDELAQRLALAVERGAHAVRTEAEKGLAAISGASAAPIVVNVGGFWRSWCQEDYPGAAFSVFAGTDLPPNADQIDEPTFHAGMLFLPIRVGALAALIQAPKAGRDGFAALRVAAGCVDLAITTCERRDPSIRVEQELIELHRPASRLLAAVGPEEIVLITSSEARRLIPADICAVLMRVGNDVLTRHCIGDFSLNLERLNGEGNHRAVARVLRALQPLDRLASQSSGEGDDEALLSAMHTPGYGQTLSAPIISPGDAEGAIDIWRRGGGEFGRSDYAKLAAIAALSSMALNNAQRDKLVSGLADSSSVDADYRRFQFDLAGQLLLGKGLDGLAARLAQHCGASVSVFDADGSSISAVTAPVKGRASRDEHAYRRLPSHARSDKPQTIRDAGGVSASHPVILSGDVVGHILLIDAGISKMHHLALSHAAVVAALMFQRQRIATEARNESVQTIIWDLLEGSDFERGEALKRAKQHGISTTNACSVAIVAIENIAAISDPQQSGRGFNRLIEIARGSGLGQLSEVLGLRGTELRAVCRETDKPDLIALGDELIAELRRELPQLKVAIGFSGMCGDLSSLSTAFREARVAVEVAQHQSEPSATHYSDVGLMGLLISLRRASDMHRVSREILGAVLAQPENARNTLLKTLTAFFDANCSHIGAADILGVHQKTVAYRLAKVSRLSGLNLGKHQDRLLADLAVRIFSIINMKQAPRDR